MKPGLPVLFFIIAYSTRSFSQQCGAEILHRQRLQSDTVYSKAAQSADQQLVQAVQVQKTARAIGAYYGMAATIYTIPVVVHVLHTGAPEGTIYNPSTSVIEGAINYLNSVYNGTLPGGQGVGEIGIQFRLATRDPNNNPTDGINRLNFGSIPDYVNYGIRLQGGNGLYDGQVKDFVRWDESLYYNVYVVNRIDGQDGTGWGPYVGGYAQFPGYSVHTDGTVLLATQMASGQKTLPHELGHALGLYHPFQNPADPSSSTCPANTNCFTQGDRICDTDPITVPAFAARTGANNPCTGTPYNINTEHNFMNYTEVFTLFTNDQRTTMLSAMTFPTRASLAASWATVAAYPYSFTNPVPACIPVSDTTGTNNGFAGLLGVSVDNRRFSSGLTATDPGYVNKAMSPLHLIPLSPNASYSLSTDVFAVNEQQIAAYIDYNNDGLFDNATERIAYQDRIYTPGAQVTRYTRAFTVPSFAAANTVLRMRVINELASVYNPHRPVITTGCYNPIYGQGEDFPVFIAGILPASWKYFKGRKIGTEVQLQWGLSTELKQGLFEIERSTDGSDYSRIGSLSASERIFQYNYTDHDATLPLYFYRLKQTDAAGNSKYSSTIIIRNDQPDEENAVHVSNPFHDFIQLSFDQPFANTANIELIDLNGRRILSRQLAPGQTLLRIDVNNYQLSAGVYMIKISAGDLLLTRKIIRQ